MGRVAIAPKAKNSIRNRERCEISRHFPEEMGILERGNIHTHLRVRTECVSGDLRLRLPVIRGDFAIGLRISRIRIFGVKKIIQMD